MISLNSSILINRVRIQVDLLRMPLSEFEATESKLKLTGCYNSLAELQWEAMQRATVQTHIE